MKCTACGAEEMLSSSGLCVSCFEWQTNRALSIETSLNQDIKLLKESSQVCGHTASFSYKDNDTHLCMKCERNDAEGKLISVKSNLEAILEEWKKPNTSLNDLRTKMGQIFPSLELDNCLTFSQVEQLKLRVTELEHLLAESQMKVRDSYSS